MGSVLLHIMGRFLYTVQNTGLNMRSQAFLLAGWKSALLQLVILCVSFFVYLPFIKKVDKMNLVQEKNQPVEDEDEDW